MRRTSAIFFFFLFCSQCFAQHLGYVPVDSTIRFYFTSNDGSGGRVDPSDSFEAADFRIYKNGSATERSSTAGYTITTTFDSLVGVHALAVDLSNNTDAGFFVGGADYVVMLYPDETVDGQNISSSVGSFSIGSQPADIVAVSGDATAADNLESQYDGTGISGETFPATQAAVGNMASGTAAINTTAISAPGGFVLTTGANEVNDEDNTHALDGVFHSLEDSGGTTDGYYIFNVGGNGVPVSVSWSGYANSNGDSFSIYAYNWLSTAWEQTGTVLGSNGTTVISNASDLTNAHVGTGANLGLVRWRFYSTDGTKFSTDRILCSYAIVSKSVGYAGGAIWVDSAGTAGSEDYVNGVADNPCPWANALVISNSLGLKRFHVANDVTITLDAAFNDKTLYGEHYYLALGGQSVNDSFIKNATVTGISSATNHTVWEDCEIGSVTMPPCKMTRCGIGLASGAFIAASDGQYVFHNCYSMVPGSGSPSFTFTGLGSATGINNRGWLGGSTYILDSDCTLSHEVLAGGGQTITTGGGAVELRGIFRTATINTSGASVSQIVGVTGPLTINGTGGTINIYGVSSTLTDNSSGTTINYETVESEDVQGLVTGVNVAQWDGNNVAAQSIAGVPKVDIGYFGGSSQSATDLKDFADAGYDPATNKVEGVKLVDTTTANSDMRGTDGASTHNAADIWSVGTRTLTSFGTLVADVWTNGTRTLTAGTKDTEIDAILVDTGTTLPAQIDGLETKVDTIDANVDAYLPFIPAHPNQVYYVNGTSGSDANDGKSPAASKETIGAAITAAGPGDMIRVVDNTYSEPGFVIPAGKDGLQIICEHGTILQDSGSRAQTFLISSESVILSNCEVKGVGQIAVQTDANFTSLYNIRSGSQSTIGFNINAREAFLDKCTAYNPSGTGFAFVGGRSSIVRDCFAVGFGNSTTGFLLTGSNRAMFIDCHSDANATAGFQVDAGVSEAKFVNCTSGHTDGAKVDNGTDTSWRNFSIVETVGGGGDATEANQTLILADLAEIEGTGFTSETHSLVAIRERGDTAWVTGGVGSGAIEYTYNVTDTTSGLPLQGVTIEVSTDPGKANVVASGLTDSFGDVTFNLDAGTYYFWKRKPGYNADTEPDVEVVE